jgi:hypothetical protein
MEFKIFIKLCIYTVNTIDIFFLNTWIYKPTHCTHAYFSQIADTFKYWVYIHNHVSRHQRLERRRKDLMIVTSQVRILLWNVGFCPSEYANSGEITIFRKHVEARNIENVSDSVLRGKRREY